VPVADGEGEKEPGGNVGRALMDTRVANAVAVTEAVDVGSEAVTECEADTEAKAEAEGERVASRDGASLGEAPDAEGEALGEVGALPMGETVGETVALARERVAQAVAEGDDAAESVATVTLESAVALGAADVVLETRGEWEDEAENEDDGELIGEALSVTECEGEPVADTDSDDSVDSDVDAEAEGQPESEACAEVAPLAEEDAEIVPPPSSDAEGAALPLRPLGVAVTLMVRLAVRVGEGAVVAVAIDAEALRVGADSERRAVSVVLRVIEWLLRGELVTLEEKDTRGEVVFEARFDATAGALFVAAPANEGDDAAERVGDGTGQGVAVGLSDGEPDSEGDREAGASEADAVSEGDADGEALEALGCSDLVPPRESVGVLLPPEEERVGGSDRVAPAAGESEAGMLFVGVLSALGEGSPLTDCEAAGLLEGRTEGDDERLPLGEPLELPLLLSPGDALSRAEVEGDSDAEGEPEKEGDDEGFLEGVAL
jgi:hypothetical protein